MADLCAVGIDLGTTYSSIAIVNAQGNAEIIPNAESDRLTPSAVFFDDDVIVVGQIAKDAAQTDPERVVLFVKRQMGAASWHFTYDQQRLTADEISSKILTKLKNDAEKRLGRKLPYAVITVPAYFDDERRRATIKAGEKAGFQVLALLNEPTAAAIAFGIDRRPQAETVLVYDLGGGTLDVTIMRVEGKEIRILSCEGDHQLGGKDFDDAIMGCVVERFVQEHGFDPSLDAFVSGELRAQAEKAKRELSKRSRSLVVLRAEGKVSRVEITREEFESRILPKLETSLTIVRAALAEAKLKAADIDRVLLIGGSTRVPAVRALLEKSFGREPDTSVDPDEAVAIGASLMAALKAAEKTPEPIPEPVVEKIGGLEITDVTSHSIGLETQIPGTQKRMNTILIPHNTPLPASRSKEFVTNVAGMTALKVTIYQGEFSEPELCNPIGEFMMTGLPPNRPAGRKVRVTVSCNEDGVIHVSALDIESGKETTTQVSYRSDAVQAAAGSGAKDRWKKSTPVV